MLVLLTVFTSARLRDSRLGRAWVAIREDEVAAAAMGVPLMRTKTWAYATGAFFGGVAGAYYASYKSGAFPDDFFFNISVFILCMVILGGMGNIWGVIFGACFLAYLDREGLANVGALDQRPLRDTPASTCRSTSSGSSARSSSSSMLFRPEGLIPSQRRAAELHEGVHDEPLYDVRTMSRSREPTSLLQTDRLRKEFGGLVAVDDVDFTVPSNSIVSLIGPNGAGKTTFFNMLTGVYKPTAGRVFFDGEDMTGKPPHAFTQRGIGRTFQNIRLFQNMTALENVLVGMHVRLKGNLFEAILRTPRVRSEEKRGARAGARAARVLRACGASDDELGKNLSYGDQRRLEVARALATAAEAAAARRADGRHEPAGDGRLHRVRRAAARGAGARRCC